METLWSKSTIALLENNKPFTCSCGGCEFYVSNDSKFYKCFKCEEIYKGS